MADKTILIIEDEKNIIELIKYNLEQEGFQAISRTDGESGLVEALRANHELLVLDLMLPGLDGIEICKTLKSNHKTAHIPIVMLTAKSQEADRILGLEIGADDYMTKPFSPRELVARVKAVLRRGKEKAKDPIYRAGELKLDTAKYLVTLKEKPVELSSKEFNILKAFMEANGRVLSRDYFHNEIWGYEGSLRIETRSLDVHIGQLRKKLRLEAKRLVTVKNVGYRFDLEE